MSNKDKKIIRCAIYTRKSSEEGLEQDFNSLDAQRESCENYIKSQQHEGWTIVEKQYNDGGFSGGTLERPAVKELFKDIEAGEVDIVVVYKVDRLTRSLMDFSKIVELFDKHCASFVSITQQFNTTTSMGRLTLNILLSFAQFEREVTGERIRDKIAASKKKGMWMSGVAPLGYKLENKKLIIDEPNAQKVRIIFDKYLELKSVPKLKIYLHQNNILTKGNKVFSKGHLYKILQTKTFIGVISHKEKEYLGQHEAIIKKEIFKNVQELLTQNRIIKKSGVNFKNASLLAGKLFDGKGNYMSPSHSNTRNRKYRYYVSQAIIQGRKNEVGSISKIPADEIENVVFDELRNFLSNIPKIQNYLKNLEITKQQDVIDRIKKLQKENLESIFIRAVINKIVLYKEKIEIMLSESQLLKVFMALTYELQMPEELKTETGEPIFITKNIRISSTAKNGSVLIISDSEKSEKNINLKLINAIAKSHYWNNLILSGEVKGLKELQQRENFSSNKYVKNILKLKFLAPDIVEKILTGRQPKDLTVQKLIDIKTLDWNEQRRIIKL
ncbi:MAG: recombinase family protein [Candidatus Gastranaerophilales bacterium]|nr:recombinase family protein [Candidatus Gastranaerophilales bacterium]